MISFRHATLELGRTDHPSSHAETGSRSEWGLTCAISAFRG
jgi:hypothetical protein